MSGPLQYRGPDTQANLNKSRQTFHHSLKEHHKISNIPKFRCENVVKCGLFSLAKFAVFQSFCITNGKLRAPKGIGRNFVIQND